MDISDIKEIYKDREPYIDGWKKMKRAAVAIPLIEREDGIYIMFQVRAKTMKAQPGDISFPGGRIEDGEAPEVAALRELEEETGILKSKVEVIKELDIHLRHDGMIIHPYLVFIRGEYEANINASEVDHLFYVPLEYLINNKPLEIENKLKVERNKHFPYELINNGENYKFKEGKYISLFYRYKEYVIWGITAKILRNFLREIEGKMV